MEAESNANAAAAAAADQTDLVSIEDLELPKAVITRILKNAVCPCVSVIPSSSKHSYQPVSICKMKPNWR